MFPNAKTPHLIFMESFRVGCFENFSRRLSEDEARYVDVSGRTVVKPDADTLI